MSLLRTVDRTKPARGFGTGTDSYKQLQVKHFFTIDEKKSGGAVEIHIVRIKKPKWEDVPHEEER